MHEGDHTLPKTSDDFDIAMAKLNDQLEEIRFNASIDEQIANNFDALVDEIVSGAEQQIFKDSILEHQKSLEPDINDTEPPRKFEEPFEIATVRGFKHAFIHGLSHGFSLASLTVVTGGLIVASSPTLTNMVKSTLSP